MKIPHVRRDVSVEFNLTPLIDIVFLLIIFFLVASHFVTRSAEQTVELPVSAFADRDLDGHHDFVITIRDGGYFLGSERLPLIEVTTRLQRHVTSIDADHAIACKVRADATAPYHLIEPILAACAKLPQVKFKLAVDQRSQ